MGPVLRRSLAAGYIPAVGRSIAVLGYIPLAELLLLLHDGVLRRTSRRLRRRIGISIGSILFYFCVDDGNRVMLAIE